MLCLIEVWWELMIPYLLAGWWGGRHILNGDKMTGFDPSSLATLLLELGPV